MYINNIITICCIAVGVLLLWLLLSMFLHIWRRSSDRRAKAREEALAEDKKWDNSKITKENKLFWLFRNERLLIFAGHQGSGKTIMSNLYAHWLADRFYERNARNYRFDKFINPDYLREVTNLYLENKLPIYSNIPLQDAITGATKQDIFPILYQVKRAQKDTVLFLDEISRFFGKEKYLQAVKKDDEDAAKLAKVQELGRFLRQIGVWFIGTEQTENNFWKGLRDSGYASVICEKTIIKTTKKGKVLQRIIQLLNAALPALSTCNLCKLWQQQLFKSNRFLFALKLLLPAFVVFPREYYNNKMRINQFIENRYTVFETLTNYNGIQNWLRYTRADIYQYNTTAHRSEYERQFDRDGNLLWRSNAETPKKIT